MVRHVLSCACHCHCAPCQLLSVSVTHHEVASPHGGRGHTVTTSCKPTNHHHRCMTAERCWLRFASLRHTVNHACLLWPGAFACPILSTHTAHNTARLQSAKQNTLPPNRRSSSSKMLELLQRVLGALLLASEWILLLTHAKVSRDALVVPSRASFACRMLLRARPSPRAVPSCTALISQAPSTPGAAPTAAPEGMHRR